MRREILAINPEWRTYDLQASLVRSAKLLEDAKGIKSKNGLRQNKINWHNP